MKKLITLCIIITSALISCNTMVIKGSKTYSTFAAVPEIDAYRIRVMQLPSGSIPVGSVSVPIADTTHLAFRWYQEFSTTPYGEQSDPVMYGTSSDTVVMVLEEGDFTYDDPDAAASSVHSLSQVFPFVEGEYQVQVAGCTWSTKNQSRVWAKYSDAYAFYTYMPSDPPTQSTNVTITIGGAN